MKREQLIQVLKAKAYNRALTKRDYAKAVALIGGAQ